MSNPLQPTVGAECYIVHSTYHSIRSNSIYLKGRITGVTPSGRVNVKAQDSETTWQLRPTRDGWEQRSGYYTDRLELDVAAVTQRLAKDAARRVAYKAMAECKLSQDFSSYAHHWGKEGLLNELTALEAKVAAARAAVEAL